jgi:hypothetical protein
MIYTDNDGLFETRKEARQYKREHKEEIAGNSKIVKNGEGGFDLIDRENNIAYTRSKDNYEGSGENFKNDGVMESGLAIGDREAQSNWGVYSGNNIFAETYSHFQTGGGNPLYVSTSSLDFSGVTQKNLKSLGNGRYGLDLYKANPASQTALSLGKITLVSQGNNQFSIEKDRYDFNIEWQNGFSKRNIATFGAGALHYGAGLNLFFGGPYDIYFNGNVTIKP